MISARVPASVAAVAALVLLCSPPASANRITAATGPTVRTRVTAPQPHLPRGGTKIIGHYRVVAYYGAANTGALGVLGATSPEQAARAIGHRAAGFAPYHLPVQPTMELLATVAQAAAGADGDYSEPVSHATIRRYLAVAHEHKMLLVLDLQPGRASFLSQARSLRSLLLDPSVSLALDPEWKVGPHQKPGGGRIGSSSAAGVNAVGRYLSALIAAHHLPDKLLVVHEFTSSMLPNRSKINRYRGVETTFHADGFGSPREKVGVYGALHFPAHPFGAGFKLFLTQDSRLMSPAEVMALRPRPDIVTYQ